MRHRECDPSSTLFGVRAGRSPNLARVVGTIADDHGRSGRYLTDGLTLYRYIGIVASGMGRMVELEDCRSLELTWLPIRQLRRLRAVIPTPSGQRTGPPDHTDQTTAER
jgi:hypothetical protein